MSSYIIHYLDHLLAERTLCPRVLRHGQRRLRSRPKQRHQRRPRAARGRFGGPEEPLEHGGRGGGGGELFGPPLPRVERGAHDGSDDVVRGRERPDCFPR